ncbi:transmembrane protein 127 [Salminus brasiliensis]|uniref:transmembrane protein 127 n=1 Tax=Salminus brasiliensis TaxID=930266 RepID=UPI003B82E1F2
MTLSMSPAAVCQCFTLVALCTSIADPNWIQVSNGTGSSKQLIYGVAFTLHAAQNLTDTGPLGGVNGWGMWLLYTLAAVCYGAVLLSSSSFLMDFLGVGFTHSRLVASLHFSTALLCMVVLGVCGACLYVIQQNLQKGRLALLWARPVQVPSVRASGLHATPGESFYIEMLGLVFSFLALGFSIKCPSQPIQYLPVEHEEEERQPLTGAMGLDREEWVEGEESNTEYSLHI